MAALLPCGLLKAAELPSTLAGASPAHDDRWAGAIAQAEIPDNPDASAAPAPPLQFRQDGDLRAVYLLSAGAGGQCLLGAA